MLPLYLTTEPRTRIREKIKKVRRINQPARVGLCIVLLGPASEQCGHSLDINNNFKQTFCPLICYSGLCVGSRVFVKEDPLGAVVGTVSGTRRWGGSCVGVAAQREGCQNDPCNCCSAVTLTETRRGFPCLRSLLPGRDNKTWIRQP